MGTTPTGRSWPRALAYRAATVVSKVPLSTALRLLGEWPGVLVLNYHRIGRCDGQPWDPQAWSTTAEELDSQLRTLARHTQVIGPGEVSAAMDARPGRRVLITFDDGYRDNYELAFPLLRKHSLSATFFLVTGFLDSPRVAWWDEIAWMVNRADRAMADARQRLSRSGAAGRASLLPAELSFALPTRDATIAALIMRYWTLPDGDGEPFLEELGELAGSGRCDASEAVDMWVTWGMARELHAAGMSIGGHTATHPVLARLSAECQREEVTTCGRRLHEELGTPMRWFAYPVGGRDTFTPVTQRALHECGVELAFSFYGGFVRPSQWEPLDVPRMHVDPRLTPRLLHAALAGGRR
jgi:peptidoglycan/xylan/chitin deacetylase (PgdA/CDA1 family)